MVPSPLMADRYTIHVHIDPQDATGFADLAAQHGITRTGLIAGLLQQITPTTTTINIPDAIERARTHDHNRRHHTTKTTP